MQNETDCPKHHIEVRRRPNGKLDEIVARRAFVHLEEMDDNCTWLGVTKNGYRQSTFITAVIEDGKAVLKYSSFMDDSPEKTFVYHIFDLIVRALHRFVK